MPSPNAALAFVDPLARRHATLAARAELDVARTIARHLHRAPSDALQAARIATAVAACEAAIDADGEAATTVAAAALLVDLRRYDAARREAQCAAVTLALNTATSVA